MHDEFGRQEYFTVYCYDEKTELPGEYDLLAQAQYAATKHKLDTKTLVIFGGHDTDVRQNWRNPGDPGFR
jgi:hypothetical protein